MKNQTTPYIRRAKRYLLMLNKIAQSRPLIVSTLLGLLLIPLLYLINSYSPAPEKAPKDYNSVILAFEFVSDEQELTEVLSPLTLEEINGLDMLNKVDFAFMLLYGAFLLSIVVKLRKLHQHKWLTYLAGMVVIIVLADFLENLQLLKLTEAYRSATTDQGIIDQLAIFTWTKWILLAVVIAGIGHSLITAERYKGLGYALFIPIVLGFSAVSLQTAIIEDTFGTSIFLFFFILWVLSFLYKAKRT